MKRIFIYLIFSFTSATIYAQTSPKQEIEKLRNQITETGKDINWEEFDTTSKVSIDKIQIELLQGEWKAYNGLFRFGGSVNSMGCNSKLRFFSAVICFFAPSNNQPTNPCHD